MPPGQEAHWGGKKKFLLGHTLTEAYQAWAARMETRETITTIGQLIEPYEREVIPGHRLSTRRNKLGHVFGAMPIDAIEPWHIYAYADRRGKRTAAKREIETLSISTRKQLNGAFCRAIRSKAR
ncbi:hypothetical protein QWY84_19445 [Aquisalimonas lutea]|uniref:hypothetical protein n=1 Tax=Aquisalimonas lutea TaxID=1327750 RepID=UPI0025B4D09B|nr:hypothetical protein [Aquisalimonas lutea]MDN3519786.1 hypothetical protein [Aquisalimonas lutea]